MRAPLEGWEQCLPAGNSVGRTTRQDMEASLIKGARHEATGPAIPQAGYISHPVYIFETIEMVEVAVGRTMRSTLNISTVASLCKKERTIIPTWTRECKYAQCNRQN